MNRRHQGHPAITEWCSRCQYRVIYDGGGRCVWCAKTVHAIQAEKAKAVKVQPVTVWSADAVARWRKDVLA